MTPLEYIAIGSALLTLLNKTIIPKIEELAQKGELTPEQLATIRTQYDSLKNRTGGEFKGSEFDKSGR